MVIKKSFINYIIECYKNFPELLEMFPEDNLKNKLNQNISTIKRCKVNKEYGGCYYCSSRKINIASKNKINIDKIKNDYKLTIVAVHEATHALFKKYIYSQNTGCAKKSFESILKKPKIRKNIKYKSSTKLRNFINNINNDFNLGNAMNEGFTEWVTKKCVGTYGSYIFNREIIDIIELTKGTKETLKIGKGNYKEIRKLLNMDKKTFIEFMSKFDIFQDLDYKKTKGDPILEEENAKIKLKKEITQTLVNSLVIPELESNIDFSKKGYERFKKIKNYITDIYYDQFFDYKKSFFDMFPKFDELNQLYNDNSDIWLADYNKCFDELSDLEIENLNNVIFESEKILKTKEAKDFIKKMQKKDQINIDNIKKQVRQECMNEEPINLVKVNDIILSSYYIDFKTVNCKSQVIQMLIGKELKYEDERDAVLEFDELITHIYDEDFSDSLINKDGTIIGETRFFDKNKFMCKAENYIEEENISVEDLDDIEKDINDECENNSDIINEDLDDEDLLEENNYNLFNIVGKSIYKYKLKLKEILNSKVRYIRKNLKKGVDSNEFEEK